MPVKSPPSSQIGMSNKEILQKVIDAFDANDIESIVKYMADDVEWHMLGDKIISGKDEVRKFFAENANRRMLSSTKNHVIIEGDHAAVDGDVQCTGEDGKPVNLYYCDIYELENGKVNKIVSYTLNKKK
jgi:uncharacterized protein